MPPLSPEKQQFIDSFLAAPLIARLGTADASGAPHVVPVWYGWDGTSIWISSFASTRKIGQLEHNSAVSICIDTSDPNGKAKAVVFEGHAELVKEPRDLVHEKSLWIYTRYLGPEGVLAAEPQSWIVDPLNLLIKLTPERVLTWEF